MSVWRNLLTRLFPAGSAGTPGVAIGSLDTGLFTPAAGNIAFASQGRITFRAQAVASAVNYVQVQPAVTAGAPIVAAQGSDTNIPLTVAAKGTGAIRLQTRGQTAVEVNATGTPSNWLRLDGAASGGAPRISAQGSDANIPLQLAPKGTSYVETTMPFRLPTYTVATLPSAATFARCLAYVSDGAGSKRLAISDGTNWRWPDGAVVS